MGDCEACSLGRVESFLKYHPHGSSRISKLENLRFLFDVPIAQWIRVGPTKAKVVGSSPTGCTKFF